MKDNHQQICQTALCYIFNEEPSVNNSKAISANSDVLETRMEWLVDSHLGQRITLVVIYRLDARYNLDSKIDHIYVYSDDANYVLCRGTENYPPTHAFGDINFLNRLDKLSRQSARKLLDGQQLSDEWMVENFRHPNAYPFRIRK